MKRRYCKHVMCRTCMQQCSHIIRVCHASVVRGCVPLSVSSSLIYHFWFLKHHHSAATPHHHRRCWRCCCTHENCMRAKQIIIIFYIFIFIFCSMYLVLFSIVLYRTIVTVYSDNIFLYNYLRQMHQIIHLSRVGCFTRARGKTVQKNPEVSGVKRVHWVHLILYSLHRTATDRWWEMSHSNTPPVKNRAPVTARSSSLRCVSAAEHQTAKQYSKTGRTKPIKHLPRSDLSWNTCQDILKIPSLWEAALETERRCFSKAIF